MILDSLHRHRRRLIARKRLTGLTPRDALTLLRLEARIDRLEVAEDRARLAKTPRRAPLPPLALCPRGCARIKIKRLGAAPGRVVYWAECECDWTGPRRGTARWAALAWNRRYEGR